MFLFHDMYPSAHICHHLEIFFVLCLDAARLECTRLTSRGPWLDYGLLRQPRTMFDAVRMDLAS
jgi:hypothetical protein